MRFTLENKLIILIFCSSYLCISWCFIGSANLAVRHGTAHSKIITYAKSDPADDGQKQALSGVLNHIEKLYGRGSILRLGENGDMVVECSPSGCMSLDAALGGGYPKGRVVEIYGPESSGKTTLALHAIAEIQKAGGTAAFVDAEHALDPKYAAGVGVDTDALLVTQPDSGEMALDIVDQLVRSSAVDLIVVDSVAALVPRAELEGDMGDTQMGLQARLMSKAMRKLSGSLSKSQCTVIFLNQLRSKIGVMFGSPEVTAGGNALKYYASMRLDIRRREVLRDGTGIRCEVKVVKNKVATPFKTAQLDILFGVGIDRFSSLLDVAEQAGVVERRGAWFSHGGSKNFAQGRPSAVDYLKTHPDLAEQLVLQIRQLPSQEKEEGVTSSSESEAAPLYSDESVLRENQP